jgi:hypothetical protein
MHLGKPAQAKQSNESIAQARESSHCLMTSAVLEGNSRVLGTLRSLVDINLLEFSCSLVFLSLSYNLKNNS